MIALDTSVLIAAYASWHESHEAALHAARGRPALIAPAALEAYSVMTRLPERSRVPADLVLEFLERNFSAGWLVLSSEQHGALLQRLADRRVIGGSVYDALIAETARVHDLTLMSLDRRAAVTYERVGASYRLVG